MIIFAVFVISGYSIKGLATTGPLHPDEFKPVNTLKMWDMIGFSFYSFEGIGVVLPIMEQTQDKNSFGKVLTAAIVTLAFLFSAFGFLTYAYFGTLTEKFIIYSFP